MTEKNINLIIELVEDLGVSNLVGSKKSVYYGKKTRSESSSKKEIKSSAPNLTTNSMYAENKFINNRNANNIEEAAYTKPSLQKVTPNGLQATKILVKNDLIKQIEDSLSGVNSLDDIKKILSEFDGCSLAKTATNTVFGVGNYNADVLMIGEAPGAEEDLQGEPFIGRSGKMLMRALEISGIYRKNIFITNSIFWRPPGNRNPTPEEIEICRPFLNSIISVMKPKMILTVGKIAANMLLEEEIAIGKLRGKWYTKRIGVKTNLVDNVHTRVLYHPAYLLRNPRQKKIFWFDLLEVVNKIAELNIRT